jgi:hypothetical protein
MSKTNAEKSADLRTRKYLKLLNFLSLETVLDCLNRNMLQSEATVRQYLKEVKEVEEATQAMKEIDAKIAAMSPEAQERRLQLIETQRRSFIEFTEEWIKAMKDANSVTVP